MEVQADRGKAEAHVGASLCYGSIHFSTVSLQVLILLHADMHTAEAEHLGRNNCALDLRS